MDTILYKGKEYPCKTITFEKDNETITINVSVESLDEQIVANHDEDCYEDSLIGFFVPDEMIDKGTELINYIKQNY